MSSFKVVVGLGNPGTRYDHTRHNVGFMLLDHLASGWKEKGGTELGEVLLGSEKLMLVKPLTFMNRSGEPLQKIMRFYKFEVEELVVIHDEIDLGFGTVRVKQGGGTAGHNGLKSIVQCLGSPEFVRLRLGVGRPDELEGVDSDRGDRSQMDVADWVLSKFNASEEAVLASLLERGREALALLCRDGVKSAQNVFN